MMWRIHFFYISSTSTSTLVLKDVAVVMNIIVQGERTSCSEDKASENQTIHQKWGLLLFPIEPTGRNKLIFLFSDKIAK